ncbi:hypothetical protein CC1G_01938 [Coprinopsis cinerea okayama7|uniref:PH domain-containing protein n=1 Tax=Coprinopsis cinerea (strain Okayama-7 / 130 / ATCC MYA-4618 / FGSC 9003) TaxID=240176 RepID=A8N610_COPC7|nr:hypothetical protein CC1G_01938 [Coprinopsis cinerea okayama7\|eukprot:XP_001830302.2 hypothetical protein CC1G_01938 [Coprinopsis cinerea okayama7\
MVGPRSMSRQCALSQSDPDSGPKRPTLQHRKSTKQLVKQYEDAILEEQAASSKVYYGRGGQQPGLSRAHSTNSRPVRNIAAGEPAATKRSTYHSDSQYPHYRTGLASPPAKKDKDNPLRHSFRNLLTILKKGKLGSSSKDLDKDRPIFPPPGLSATNSRDQTGGRNRHSISKELPLLPLALSDDSRPLLSRSQTQTGTLIYLTTLSPVGGDDSDGKRTVHPAPLWTTSTITLKDAKITVSWFSDTDGGGTTMIPCIHEIDLVGCSDIRSIDLNALDPAAVQALDAWGSAGKGRGHAGEGEDEDELKVFEILFERKPREVFAVRSVRERAKWISAFWDSILPSGDTPHQTKAVEVPEPYPDASMSSKSDELMKPRPPSLSTPVPPRISGRTSTDRSLPPLPVSRQNSSSQSRSVPAKPNDSFKHITNEIVKTHSNNSMAGSVASSKYSSASSIPELPTPIQLRVSSRSQSSKGRLKVKNGMLSPDGGSSVYSRGSPLSSTFSDSSSGTASTGLARRPPSSSIANLSHLSVVKQRVAQMERKGSDATTPPTPTQHGNGKRAGGGASGVSLGSHQGTRAGSIFTSGSGFSSKVNNRNNSNLQHQSSTSDTAKGSKSSNSNPYQEKKKGGQEQATKKAGTGATAGDAGFAPGGGNEMPPVSGLPLPERGPTGIDPAGLSSNATRMRGEDSIGDLEDESHSLSPHHDPAPVLGAYPGAIVFNKSTLKGDGEHQQYCHNEKETRVVSMDPGVSNTQTFVGREEKMRRQVGLDELQVIASGVREIKLVLGGLGVTGEGQSARIRTGSSADVVSTADLAAGDGNAVGDGLGGNGTAVGVGVVIGAANPTIVRGGAPTIHQIALGLDHRLNTANETLLHVKEALESMERRLGIATRRDGGSSDRDNLDFSRGSGIDFAHGRERKGEGDNDKGAMNRNRSRGGGSDGARDGSGVDRADGDVANGVAEELGALLRDIKMQLASELPVINNRILELSKDVADAERRQEDHRSRSSRTHDVTSPGSVHQAALDLIPLQTTLEKVLGIVGTNHADSAATSRELKQEASPLVTGIVSLLEDDVTHREQQALQQVDSVRYLNELNKIQSLAANIDALCAELGTPVTLPPGVDGDGGGSMDGTGSVQQHGAPGSTHLLSNVRQLVLGMKARDQNMASLQASVNDLIAVLNSESRLDSNELARMIELQKRNQEVMLRTFTNEISGEIKGERLRFVEAMREATAINVQQHVEQFKKELGREVMTMANELERLQRDKQDVEHQIADLFTFYSKKKAETKLPNPYLQRNNSTGPAEAKTTKITATTKPLDIDTSRRHRHQSLDPRYYKVSDTTERPLPFPKEMHWG